MNVIIESFCREDSKSLTARPVEGDIFSTLARSDEDESLAWNNVSEKESNTSLEDLRTFPCNSWLKQKAIQRNVLQTCFPSK